MRCTLSHHGTKDGKLCVKIQSTSRHKPFGKAYIYVADDNEDDLELDDEAEEPTDDDEEEVTKGACIRRGALTRIHMPSTCLPCLQHVLHCRAFSCRAFSCMHRAITHIVHSPRILAHADAFRAYRTCCIAAHSHAAYS